MKGPEPGSKNPAAVNNISLYIFSFELIKQYPTTRSFILKQQLKRSMTDTLTEFLGTPKK